MKTLCITVALVQTLTTAFSQVTLFSGSDSGAAPAGPWPNSANAAAAFDTAAGHLGSIYTINFEALPLGQFASLPLMPGVTATQTGYDPGVGGIVANGYATPVGATGFNTTPGGSRFLGFVPSFNVGTATLDFAFSTPVQAWGAYVVGLDSAVAGSVSVQFNDGSANSYALQDLNSAGVEYFGFTDPNRSIVHITLVETGISGTRDIYGVDDVSFVVVPEPSTWVLLTGGLSGLFYWRRVVKQRAIKL